MTAKTEALERVWPVEETVVKLLASWTLEEIDTVRKRDEGPATVESVNPDFMTHCKQVSAHETVHSELHDA